MKQETNQFIEFPFEMEEDGQKIKIISDVRITILKEINVNKPIGFVLLVRKFYKNYPPNVLNSLCLYLIH